MRGSDLPDGKFSFETFVKIVLGILFYEALVIPLPGPMPEAVKKEKQIA